MEYTRRFEFEALNESHFIQGFKCCDDEDDDIADYLRSIAIQDIAVGHAQTTVLIDNSSVYGDSNVAGFFTLRADALRIDSSYFGEEHDPEDAWGSHAGIDVPLIELMYIARDCAWKRRIDSDISIGDVLMIEVMKRVVEVAAVIGTIGLHLRSSEKGVPLYERYDFRRFREHPRPDQYRYMLPITAIREIVSLLGD